MSTVDFEQRVAELEAEVEDLRGKVPQKPKPLTRKDLEGMTRQELVERWDEVPEAMQRMEAEAEEEGDQ